MLLTVEKITKRFPGVVALNRVDLRIDKGEVLAVIGENGAGKSTLMKILAGVQPPDEGQIKINGESVTFDGVEDSLDAGIALIHQELNLATNLSIGANIFLGREPHRFGVIDEKGIHREAKKFLRLVGLDESTHTLVSDLPIGRQQMVEIAKALAVDARVLIMDEPTSSLSAKESDALFAVINDLRKRDVAIIYISHRMAEVKQLADRVTALRDGENAGELDRADVSHDAMVRLMVGRDVEQFYTRTRHEPGETVLEVRELRSPEHPEHPVSFSLKTGEVVAISGLIGAGRTELIQSLFGATPPLSGEVIVAGEPITPQTPGDAIAAGIALVPEDRKQQGLIIDMSVRENVSLASLRRDRKSLGVLNTAQEQFISAEMTEKLNVKMPSDGQIIRFLSGGNQQKVVLGKWLAMNPKVLLLDEPTRGIDVGAKREIYQLIDQLASEGMAILVISSELEEVLGLADRVLVMHEGQLAGTLDRSEMSEESIMQLATGALKTESRKLNTSPQ